MQKVPHIAPTLQVHERTVVDSGSMTCMDHLTTWLFFSTNTRTGKHPVPCDICGPYPRQSQHSDPRPAVILSNTASHVCFFRLAHAVTTVHDAWPGETLERAPYALVIRSGAAGNRCREPTVIHVE